MDRDSSSNRGPRLTPTTFSPNGRIMLVSVVVLFVALLIIICFHMNTRCCLIRRRRLRHGARDLSSSSSNDATAAHVNRPTNSTAEKGLPPSILKALPTFLYSINTSNREADSPECAVCLTEFEGGETGRILPNCKHCFHVDCIDMWFQTHSNCPLCRAPVQNPDGTLVILVQLHPNDQFVNASSDHPFALPTVWSSIIHDRKQPQLTSIRLDTLSEATPVLNQGSSAPVSSSGSNWPPASKDLCGLPLPGP